MTFSLRPGTGASVQPRPAEAHPVDDNADRPAVRGADLVVGMLAEAGVDVVFGLPGGAISPINTLLHLSPAELGRHLQRMAQHLERRARYLVQVGLVEAGQEPFAGSHWEASRGETSLKVDWVDEELDVVQGVSRQRSRIEVLTGPRAGEVVEEVHEMTAWTPATWAEAIEASPFDLVATYDGGTKGEWPQVEATATGGLLWHELQVVRPA